MTTVTDSRDFSRSAVNGQPNFHSTCPHCGSLHLHTFRTPITMFGDQPSLVVTCNHRYSEHNGSRITSNGGCEKRYVLDLSINATAKAIPISE